jgi:hypothetical protein
VSKRSVTVDTVKATLESDDRVVIELRGVYAGQARWTGTVLADSTITLDDRTRERVEDGLRAIALVSDASLVDPETTPEYHGYDPA